MIGRLATFAIVAALTATGVGAAIADDGSDELAALDQVELRKDDASADTELVDDDGDDPEPTGDRDKTKGDDGTNGGDNTGDGDDTGGNDGTGGGDGTGNDVSAGLGDGTRGGGVTQDGDTSVAAPAPAPAPVYDDYSDDAGQYYGGSDDGGSDG
jgi:hypothetical protein